MSNNGLLMIKRSGSLLLLFWILAILSGNSQSAFAINDEIKNQTLLSAEEANFVRLTQFYDNLRIEYADALKQRKRAFLSTVYDDNQTEKQLQKNQIKFDKTIIKVDGLETEIEETQNRLAQGEIRVNRLRKLIAKSARSQLVASASVINRAEEQPSLNDQQQKNIDRIEKKARLKLKELEKQKEEIEQLKKKEQQRLERKERKRKELAAKEIRSEKLGRKLVRERFVEKIEPKPIKDKSMERSSKKKISSEERRQEQEMKSQQVSKRSLPDPELEVDENIGPKSIKLKDNVVVVHDFNASYLNNFGQKTNVYERSPSSAIFELGVDFRDGENTGVMNLTYVKENQGGPFNNGGWCGLYSILKDEIKETYVDVSDYSYISMWVRGDVGDENFVICLADKYWHDIGDSLKSRLITSYTTSKKLGVYWQKVKIPLKTYPLNLTELASLSIGFDSMCFEDGSGQGTIYIDKISFEK